MRGRPPRLREEAVMGERQRVLVTAGANGIGREIVRAFAAGGAAVFTCDIDAAALEALTHEIDGLQSAVCDIARRDDIERMVAAAAHALGGIDVLVNNAGIAGPTAPVEAFDPDAWDQVLQVNLSGSFNVTRLAIPHLKRSRAGSIINMSSVAGRFGYANRSAYSTSKWGLVGFTKTLAIELGGDGIRVNAILPGAVDGERLQRVLAARAGHSGRSLEEETRGALDSASIKRLVDPRDIAALAVFLASDAGKSISGQMLPIDGDMQKAT
jgi:NAD(P)-dependent dehydrogenase (short-subunit alcohol dehydrogenase family)